jgi:hypothetical protein
MLFYLNNSIFFFTEPDTRDKTDKICKRLEKTYIDKFNQYFEEKEKYDADKKENPQFYFLMLYYLIIRL